MDPIPIVWSLRDDETVTSTAAPGTQTPASPPLLEAPRTQRSADRVLLGVAGGFAQRWRVDPTLLRAALGLLSLAGGIGVVLYGVGVLCSEPRPAVTREPTPHGRRARTAGETSPSSSQPVPSSWPPVS